MADIPFEAKSDRDILILTAQAVNGMRADMKGLTDVVNEHTTEIGILKDHDEDHHKHRFQMGSVWVKTLGGLTAFAGLITAGYYLGHALSWW